MVTNSPPFMNTNLTLGRIGEKFTILADKSYTWKDGELIHGRDYN